MSIWTCYIVKPNGFIKIFFVLGFHISLQISALMDKFENQFETLDVQTAQMEDTMGNTTTLTTPQVTNTLLSCSYARNNSHWIPLKFLFLRFHVSTLGFLHFCAFLLFRTKWICWCMRWPTKQGEYGNSNTLYLHVKMKRKKKLERQNKFH